MGFSRRELVDSVLNTTRQNRGQIGTYIEEFVNVTINEINEPGWAFGKGTYAHLWNWLRRKRTLSVSSSDYVLERDVDRIGLLRQTETPIKLTQVPDERFFELIPNPTETGNPKWYRLWEVDGVSTRLSTADTVNIVSSSTSDSGDSTLAVSVSGYDSDGIWRTETYELNGTTAVSGSTTFAAREVYVSKQKDTTGVITVTENSGGTTLVKLGPKERSPRFKVVTFYPAPTSAINLYLEYYARIPILNNDSDVPMLDEKWHYVIRLGALAKTYQYLNKETDFTTSQSLYASAVRAMIQADSYQPDLVESLQPRKQRATVIGIKRADDTS